MPSDLQLIDAFERLREQFVRENASYQPEPAYENHLSPQERAMAAWIQAMDGRPAAAGAPQRRLRAMTRAITDEQRELHEFSPEEIKLIQSGRGFSKEIDSAPCGSASRSVAEEIGAWKKRVPGLSGLRAWRFMERLGKPVAIPESSLRRMLWRLGLIDSQAGDDRALIAAHDAMERIAQLTGLSMQILADLARWTTIAGSGWKGGGWCGARPRCGECPLSPACPWARFRPDTADPSDRTDLADLTDQSNRRAGESFRRQMLEGRQDQLQDTQLLALLFPGRIVGSSPMKMAEALLTRFGSLRGVERAGVAELAQVRGISTSRALQLKAALELGRRMASTALQPGSPIRCSEDVWEAYRSRFRNLQQEHFLIVLLDAKNRVIQDHVVSKGTLTGSLAHPREVFQQAVREAAAAVILLHNHPSGDPTPSREDHEVTTRLKQAGEILGIRVLDHIILGADDFYSFKDEE